MFCGLIDRAMNSVPKSLRLHIGLFGRRNVGKSSLLNALTHQRVAIVSDVPGTTTDPVEKAMEFAPLGPVVFIDTAGIDDDGGELGRLRVEKTWQALNRVDVGIVVFEEWGEDEERLVAEFRRRGIPFVAVRSKCDRERSRAVECNRELSNAVEISTQTGQGIHELRQAIVRIVPDRFVDGGTIVGDLISAGDSVVLVVPIDKEAPKGRLILPQVQTIRDILDHNAYCTVCKESELANVLRFNPALVITDSQAFKKVAETVPQSIPLTSFSILFARHRSDLNEMIRGAESIGTLKAGDRVLIAEACTHHPIQDDIGTVKLPNLINKRVGGALSYDFARGHELPQDLKVYKLIIHCGACLWNRREMLSRQLLAREAGVPMTNYGVAIAYSLGILERATEVMRK